MNGARGQTVIPWRTLCDRVQAALDHGDLPARRLASLALVEAEALGQPDFGLGLLRRWRNVTSPSCDAPVVTTAGLVEHWDVAHRFGPLVLAQASRQVCQLADDNGVGVVVLHDLGGSGRLAPFATALAAAGKVGVVLAASPPVVAGHGGHAPLWGTNPFATAVPAETGAPLVVDTSTSSVTRARLLAAKATGEPLPAGVAVDADGAGTTDAGSVAALLPRGGLMGTLAAILVESLTSGLAGKAASAEGRSATVMAISPDRPVADELRERIRAAGAVEPGDRSRSTLARARASGVQVAAADLELLENLA